MKKFKKLDKDTKKMHMWFIGLMKLSVVTFVLFLITVWPALLTLVLKVHWGWYLAVTIIFAAICCKKKHSCC